MKRMLVAIPMFAMGLFVASAASGQTTVVNHLTINQWVQATPEGALVGRVLLPTSDGQSDSVQDVTVAVSSREGDVLRSKTNADGEFSIPDVEPGVYALTARGENVFACCAMHVLASDSRLDGKFPTAAEVLAANIDYTVVNRAVIRYLPPNVKTESVSIADAQLDGLASRVCGNDMFRVAQRNGGMEGRLHLPGAEGAELLSANRTNVFLFKDAMEIDRTLSDSQGQFAFANIQPGQYSLMAVGPNGIGLIGFELIDESVATAARTTADGKRLVGFGHGSCCCPEFAMQVAPMPEVTCCVDEVVVAETIIEEEIVDVGCGAECDLMDPCDPCGGGFGTPVAGGGYYGGGGGGGGGGGLGGLGALIGLGAIAAAAGNNDGGGAVILPPVIASPSIPGEIEPEPIGGLDSRL